MNGDVTAADAAMFVLEFTQDHAAAGAAAGSGGISLVSFTCVIQGLHDAIGDFCSPCLAAGARGRGGGAFRLTLPMLVSR
jgi:hypothetical protein